MESWIWCIFGCVIGFWIEFVVSRIFRKKADNKKHIGTLRVDRSDPDEAPYLFLELEPNGMDIIHKNKTVILNVNLESYLPRK